MGANTFVTFAKGVTAQNAFRLAVDQAKWERGHGGYTGTIAEKHEFVKIPAEPGKDGRKAALDHARKLIDESDPRIADKWGPAGCIDCGGGEYLFFGWASS